MAQLLTLPLARVQDANGAVYPGAKLYAYLTGTTTPTPTYTDSSLATPHPNPIVADGGGFLPPIYLDPTVVYRFLAKTSAGANIAGMDFDPVSVTASGDISFIQAGDAITRTMQDKGREAISPLDFGTTVSATSINKATSAADTYSNALWRGVEVPNGTHTVTAQIAMRRGQSLRGKGEGSNLDISSQVGAVVPAIRMGHSSGGVVDSGGQGSSVTAMTLFGGPAAAAQIDTSDIDGVSLHHIFSASPGTGFKLAASDTEASNNVFDLGLVHIEVAGPNTLITSNRHYLGRYHVLFNTGAYDCEISAMHSEYMEYYGVLFNTGATGLRGISIRNSKFKMNGQFTTAEGAIVNRATNAQFSTSCNEFRNLYGAGIRVFDAGCVFSSHGDIFDGLKTRTAAPAYDQSTTMEGIHLDGVLRASIFEPILRNLPGQPVTIGGSNACYVVIDGAVFSGNTGGTAEVLVTNTNAASVVILRNCTGDGRPLFLNSGSAVVFVEGKNYGFESNTIASAATITLPQTQNVISCTGSSNISAITANAGNIGRTVTLVFSGSLTVVDGAGSIQIGSDFVASGISTLTLTTLDGSTWYQVSRALT